MCIRDRLDALLLTADNKNSELAIEAERLIDGVEDTIETRFLRYCDPINKLHVLTSIIARAAIQAARLRVRLPRVKAGRTDAEDREDLFTLALQILDHSNAAYSDPALSKFLWHTSTFWVWDAMVWILSELRQARSGNVVETAWSKLGSAFKQYVAFSGLSRCCTATLTGVLVVIQIWLHPSGRSPWQLSTLRSRPGMRKPQRCEPKLASPHSSRTYA